MRGNTRTVAKGGDAMEDKREQVAYQLSRIRDLLELTTSTEVADLLRNPGDLYPDSALVQAYARQATATEREVC